MIGGYEFAVAANDFEIDVIKGMSESPEITLNLPYEKLLAVMSGYLPLKSLSQDEIISKRYPTKSAAVQRLQEILA